MVWIALDAGLAVVGLAVLAVLGLRVRHRVRSLTREVRIAATRLAAASAATSAVGRPTEPARDG